MNEPALDAEGRALIRATPVATLATALAADGGDAGWPYASLVLMACAFDGAPLLLLSDLAEHTRNLRADGRVSLLIDAAEETGSRLAGARLTVLGRAVATEDGTARARFLARHPEAHAYAPMTDFRLYRVEPERAHLVAGFGRIRWIETAGLRAGVSGTGSLAAAEPDVLAHMNSDHAAAVERIATHRLGLEAGPWRMTGCDPEGCDLRLGSRTARIGFEAQIATPAQARAALVSLAKQDEDS
jgi:putative heme iron utilization protein